MTETRTRRGRRARAHSLGRMAGAALLAGVGAVGVAWLTGAGTFVDAAAPSGETRPPLAVADGPVARCTAVGDRILEEVARVHEAQSNVGVQVAVAVDGVVAFEGALGLADLEHQVPVTGETVFGTASVTKAFTGTLLLMAMEDGSLDPDAPIQRYVPRFPDKPGPPVTPRLLAGHLAGLRHYRDERTPGFYATHYDDVADVLPLFADDALLSAPGAEYHYSSYGYSLLAAALQAAAGEPFQDMVRDRILEPLELSRTAFDDVRFPVPHRSERYSYYHPVDYRPPEGDTPWLVPRWDYSYNMAGGNLRSTATDLVRFGQAFTAPGFLDEPSLALLREPIRAGDVVSTRAYGWSLQVDEGGRRFLRATGSNAGVQAALVVFPEEGLSVAVLSNTWGRGSRSAEMVVGLPLRMAAHCMGWTP